MAKAPMSEVVTPAEAFELIMGKEAQADTVQIHKVDLGWHGTFWFEEVSCGDYFFRETDRYYKTAPEAVAAVVEYASSRPD
jgi:hypothetical protein